MRFYCRRRREKCLGSTPLPKTFFFFGDDDCFQHCRSTESFRLICMTIHQNQQGKRGRRRGKDGNLPRLQMLVGIVTTCNSSLLEPGENRGKFCMVNPSPFFPPPLPCDQSREMFHCQPKPPSTAAAYRSDSAGKKGKRKESFFLYSPIFRRRMIPNEKYQSPPI